MKFYVASSFRNTDMVRYVSKKLNDRGFIQTYDWTQNEANLTIERLKEIGQQEKQAVMEADFVIVLLPAGKGSHVELGIALGCGKKVYLYSPDNEVNNLEMTSTFYHLNEVDVFIGTVEGLIDYVTLSGRS